MPRRSQLIIAGRKEENESSVLLSQASINVAPDKNSASLSIFKQRAERHAVAWLERIAPPFAAYAAACASALARLVSRAAFVVISRISIENIARRHCACLAISRRCAAARAGRRAASVSTPLQTGGDRGMVLRWIARQTSFSCASMLHRISRSRCTLRACVPLSPCAARYLSRRCRISRKCAYRPATDRPRDVFLLPHR